MDYLYKKPKNDIIVQVEELPPTIVTGSEKKDSHITFISQEEYLRDIETMCQRDKWFMETIRGFCDNVVEVNVENSVNGSVEQSTPSDQSASISGEGSE